MADSLSGKIDKVYGDFRNVILRDLERQITQLEIRLGVRPAASQAAPGAQHTDPASPTQKGDPQL
jgi:hypothetical protein